MAHKRRMSAMSPEVEEPTDPDDELMFLCLGGGNEVGRSCHIIQYKGKTIMVGCSNSTSVEIANNVPSKLDAGAHPAFHGLASLPYFDEFDLSTVDILLISQYVIVLSLSRGPRLSRADEVCLSRHHATPVQLGKWLGRRSALQVEICFKPGFETDCSISFLVMLQVVNMYTRVQILLCFTLSGSMCFIRRDRDCIEFCKLEIIYIWKHNIHAPSAILQLCLHTKT